MVSSVWMAAELSAKAGRTAHISTNKVASNSLDCPGIFFTPMKEPACDPQVLGRELLWMAHLEVSTQSLWFSTFKPVMDRCTKEQTSQKWDSMSGSEDEEEACNVLLFLTRLLLHTCYLNKTRTRSIQPKFHTAHLEEVFILALDLRVTNVNDIMLLWLFQIPLTYCLFIGQRLNFVSLNPISYNLTIIT